MTKYILHSGFTSAANELNQTFYEEISRDIPDAGSIVLCYFASQDSDNTKRFKEDSTRILERSHGKTFSFLLADEENFVAQLQQSDALFIRGGSTPKLLTVLRKFPELALLLKDKTIVGSSAGAYAIGKFSAFHNDESGGKIREGLGLLPIRIVCHHESIDLPPNEGALQILLQTAPELELIYLKDYEWRVCTV